jgi:hypothetical protein
LRKGCEHSEVLGDPNSARAFGYGSHKECVPGRPASTNGWAIQWIYKLDPERLSMCQNENELRNLNAPH